MAKAKSTSKALAKPGTGGDLGFLNKADTKLDESAEVSLIAVLCVHYSAVSGGVSVNRVAMPKEMFKVRGTKGNPKLDIKPTTAKQEAERLIKLGAAIGA